MGAGARRRSRRSSSRCNQRNKAVSVSRPAAACGVLGGYPSKAASNHLMALSVSVKYSKFSSPCFRIKRRDNC